MDAEELFCDGDFPACRSSFYGDDDEDVDEATVYWKRPHEISDKPTMFIDGASRFDVVQGVLGDCWFLTACAAIAQHPELIRKVIPEGQALQGPGYTGRLTFRIWSLGYWVTVVIDDRLPLDSEGEILSARCTHGDEFWLPLLEKAFAKFHGNYAMLTGGHLVEGFVNLTGFFVENLLVSSEDKNRLFRRIQVELDNGSMLTCSRGAQWTQGLAGDHGYTVTGLHRLWFDGKLVRMVRVRNPWGEGEWTGAWCDGDSRWLQLEQHLRDQLEFHHCEDGEFWMKFSHFMKKFLEVCVATRTPDLGDNYKDDAPKTLVSAHGCWRKGINAGGPHTDLSSFATNPQYLLEVPEGDGECDVIIELMQEHRRLAHRELHPIAFFVLQTADEQRLTPTAEEVENAIACATYESISSVRSNVSLAPGRRYVIIVAASDAEEERHFLLRVLARRPVTIRTL